MALDQIHEQNNAQIKGIGGASHLVNLSDESPLVRWESCPGELYKLLFDYEIDAMDSPSSIINESIQIEKHHEDNTSFRTRFIKDVELLVAGFTVNPFEVSDFTPINNTAVQFNDEVRENIRLVPQIGEEQFLIFWNDRLIMAKVPIYKTIKENKHILASSSNSQKRINKDPVHIHSMVSKSPSAYKFRNEYVTDLFRHEMFGIAQSIATDSSTLYHGQKSDILKRLTTKPKPSITAFSSSLTIDPSGVINAKAERKYSSFLDFAQSLYKYILSIGKDFEFDILCDKYFEISLKEGVREDRGSGTKLSFNESTSTVRTRSA